MTATVFNVAPDMTSDAAFRAWGSAISAAIAALGWVKTADTGQVDWATATKPGSANLTDNFEIWACTDALQATHPIFLKVSYGTAQQVTAPTVTFQLGTATNGAGTLTSVVRDPAWAVTTTSKLIPGTLTNSYVPGNTTPAECIVAGDQSEIVMFLWLGTSVTSRGYLLTAGRTREWDGTPTPDGAYAEVNHLGTGPQRNYGNFLMKPLDGSTIWGGVKPVLGPGQSASGIEGDLHHFFPWLTGYSPRPHGPSPHLVATGPYTAFTTAQRVQLEHYGTEHTFVVGANTTNGFEVSLSGSGLLAAVRIT